MAQVLCQECAFLGSIPECITRVRLLLLRFWQRLLPPNSFLILYDNPPSLRISSSGTFSILFTDGLRGGTGIVFEPELAIPVMRSPLDYNASTGLSIMIPK